MSNKKPKMLLVDGPNWFRRKAEGSVLGKPVRECFQYIEQQKCMTIVVWDGYNAKAPRLALYPEYKARRNKPGEDFYEAQKMFMEVLKFSHAIQVRIDNYEGDDVIAALTGKYRDFFDVRIESNDADMAQLGVPMARDNFPEQPHRIALYKTIVGDTSDNIPGLKGFGEKAWNALNDFQKDTLHQIVASGEQMTDDVIAEKVSGFMTKGQLNWFMVKENRAQLLIFYKIVNFIPIPWELIESKMVAGLNRPELAEPIFTEFML